MTTQEHLSRFGKPIQEVARFTSSQGYGIGLRNFALFLLYREDWERMFTFPGAPKSITGTVQISIQQYEQLTSAALRAMSFPQLTPFLLGKRPINLSLKTSTSKGAYVLALQDSHALAICTPQLQAQPGSMLLMISRILREISPHITRVTLLSVNPAGELQLSVESLRQVPSTKSAAK